MHRLQHDTKSRELAQRCGHGMFNVTTPQLRHPAGAKDQPALPHHWAGGRDMLYASKSFDAKHLGREIDHCSWVSSFLWVPSQNSAMMLSHQMICIQI